MQFPVYLPPELEELRSISDPNNLFYHLTHNLGKLVVFVDVAFAEDVWVNRNSNFIRTLLTWVTQQYTQDRLEERIAQSIAKAIHKNYASLRENIPRTMTIVNRGKEFQANALLFGTASSVFKDLIQDEFKGSLKSKLVLDQVPESILQGFIEFGEEGTVENLWKESMNEILEMLRVATEWHIEGLAELSQENLHRYINRETVLPLLISAHKEHWKILKDACIDLFNTLGNYLVLHHGEENEFIVEFTLFRMVSLETYATLAPFTTHLICKKALSLESEFVDVMKVSPKIRSLDISESTEFSPQLSEIPGKVQELILQRCSWMDSATLGRVVRYCPQLRKLDLTSQSQINYEGWTALQQLMLHGLILNDCRLLQDEDLGLILRSCTHLKELSLSGCKTLSETALRTLSRRPSRFALLNLSRTQLSDAALVEIVYGLKTLEVIDISHCGISLEVINRIRRDFPLLRVLDYKRE